MNVPQITYKEFQEALNLIRQYKSQIDELQKDVSNQVNDVSKYTEYNPETFIYTMDIPTRLYNTLRMYFDYHHNINIKNIKLKELNEIGISLKFFSEIRNVGKNTIEELKEFCLHSDIKLIP